MNEKKFAETNVPSTWDIVQDNFPQKTKVHTYN
jgi:hypothetical protein